MQAFKNRIRTLRDLLVKSAGFGDAAYVSRPTACTSARITYAEHGRLVASVGGRAARRVRRRPGDRVAILGANCPEWIIAFWAAVSLGAIAVGLNGWSTGPEIRVLRRRLRTRRSSSPTASALDRLEGTDSAYRSS